MEDLYRYEYYEPLTEIDAMEIEESYYKLYALMERAEDLYRGIERIVERDQERRQMLLL